MNEKEIRERMKFIREAREMACRPFDEEMDKLVDALNDVVRDEVATTYGLRIGQKLLITPAFLSVLRQRGWSEGYFSSSYLGTVCTVYNIEIASDRAGQEIRGDVSIKFHDFGVTGLVTPEQAAEMRDAYIAREGQS